MCDRSGVGGRSATSVATSAEVERLLGRSTTRRLRHGDDLVDELGELLHLGVDVSTTASRPVVAFEVRVSAHHVEVRANARERRSHS